MCKVLGLITSTHIQFTFQFRENLWKLVQIYSFSINCLVTISESWRLLHLFTQSKEKRETVYKECIWNKLSEFLYYCMILLWLHWKKKQNNKTVICLNNWHMGILKERQICGTVISYTQSNTDVRNDNYVSVAITIFISL